MRMGLNAEIANVIGVDISQYTQFYSIMQTRNLSPSYFTIIERTCK